MKVSMKYVMDVIKRYMNTVTDYHWKIGVILACMEMRDESCTRTAGGY